MSINIDPEQIYNRLTKVGLEWSKHNQIACLLEENHRTQISELVCKYLDQGKSAAESNIRGRADPDLVAYTLKMTKARQLSNDYKVKYDAAKCWFEALRTKSATLRQELSSLPGKR